MGQKVQLEGKETKFIVHEIWMDFCWARIFHNAEACTRKRGPNGVERTSRTLGPACPWALEWGQRPHSYNSEDTVHTKPPYLSHRSSLQSWRHEKKISLAKELYGRELLKLTGTVGSKMFFALSGRIYEDQPNSERTMGKQAATNCTKAISQLYRRDQKAQKN